MFMLKPIIYDFLDYRLYFKSYIEYLKASDSSLNYRIFAKQLGLGSSGYITWIIQGKRKILEKRINDFAKFCDLDDAEKKYFKYLILFNNSNKYVDKKHYFQLLSISQEKEKRIITQDQFEYWNSWRHAVIRELVSIYEISNDYKEIVKLVVPKISIQEVKESLKLLERLGLIEKDENGIYRRVDEVLSSGSDWKDIAIKNYQLNLIDLSKQALLDIPKNERNISTLTMSVSEETFEEISEKIDTLREEIINMAVAEKNANKVCQLSLSLFPSSIVAEEENE